MIEPPYNTFVNLLTIWQRSFRDSITWTTSDRVASNPAAIICLINEPWNKVLNELNCHLHPLDCVASSARSSLKSAETSKGKLFGNDCFSVNNCFIHEQDDI